jgi:hypothetical protein
MQGQHHVTNETVQEAVHHYELLKWSSIPSDSFQTSTTMAKMHQLGWGFVQKWKQYTDLTDIWHFPVYTLTVKLISSRFLVRPSYKLTVETQPLSKGIPWHICGQHGIREDLFLVSHLFTAVPHTTHISVGAKLQPHIWLNSFKLQ